MNVVFEKKKKKIEHIFMISTSDCDMKVRTGTKY